MRTQSKSAAAAIETYFETPSNYAHAANVADLVLESLPNGEHAWLRPQPHPVRVVDSLGAPLDPAALFTLTDLGRRALAEAALFDPGPTVADAIRIGTCPACHQLQTAPSCPAREHWGV